jgi:acyl-CoA synthetase (AMP-forming)/AMP-acid ligase II
LVSALGVRRRDGSDFESMDEIVELASRRSLRSCPAPPLMHGAAHWNAISTWTSGGTVVIQDHPEHLDAADILRTIERERVGALNIVGDAFARPLLEELRTGTYDVSSLRHIVSGGAVLSSSIKQALTELIPGLTVVDIVGSSESGRQGVGTGTSTGAFEPSPTACVLSDDRTRRLQPGDDEVGWLAQTGRMPRGYLGDKDKTQATFPIIGGVRHVIAGDRARLGADGRIELLGRESVTINTGGEKVFAEEVELALKHHPAVYDALVVGRPSERWGQEVVAVVRLRDGEAPDDAELVATAAEHVARYKLPKQIVRVDAIERSASGKPDYQWARAVAVDAG